MNKVFSRKRKNLYINLRDAGLVALLTILVLLVVMKTDHVVPFGDNSFASQDAKLQYLDFFAYYKDVLAGKNSIRYTLTSGLGMSTIGIFAYYLMSPFNLLIVFFSKSDLNSFFSLVVVLKIATAGALMTVFLNERFQYRLKPVFTILLSLAYALMQYNFAQSSNIMWLDGVYMLPLILLGTYYAARRNRTLFLTVSVAVAILIEWYTAGINCLYSIVWFAMELAFARVEESITNKETVKRIIHYLWGMFLGVLISCVLFLPNIIAMLQGKGSFDWDYLKPDFKGNVLQTILRYSIGSISESNGVSLFCGGLVLLGIIGFFSSKQFSKKEKTIAGIMTAFSIMIYYWQPLFFLYSLLKNSSYWFRYAYLTIFLMIFLAADYYCEWDKSGNVSVLVKGATVFSFVLLLLKFISGEEELNLIYYTIICILAEAFLLVEIKNNHSHKLKSLFILGLCVIAVAELFENGKVLTRKYAIQEVDSYQQYVKEEEQQISAIKEYDKGMYRISQTKTRDKRDNNLTLIYNESMAFNYDGIASYSSSPQKIQLDLLQKSGYRTEADCISIINTSIIPVDSLLGVKYILSDYDITGYRMLGNLPAADQGKRVYLNPYALPMSFVYSSEFAQKNPDHSDNPFEYVNYVYSELVGHKINVFQRVPYEVSSETGEISYHLHDIDVNGPVYGNIPSKTNSDAIIDVNGKYTQGYACWLSPSVFYIPVSGSEADLKITSDNQMDFSEPQFYVCDLDILKTAVKEISSHQAKITSYQDGDIKISANCTDQNENLILSVPYNSGWSVKVNGKTAKLNSFENGLSEVSLRKGKNGIEFHYTIPGLKAGAVVSLAGILLLILTEIISAAMSRRKSDHVSEK